MLKRLLCLLFLLATAFQASAAGPAGAPRVTVEELKAMLDSGAKVTVIDVRSKGSYDSSHAKIKGAVRVPFLELEQRAGDFDRDLPIIAYCS